MCKVLDTEMEAMKLFIKEQFLFYLKSRPRKINSNTDATDKSITENHRFCSV